MFLFVPLLICQNGKVTTSKGQTTQTTSSAVGHTVVTKSGLKVKDVKIGTGPAVTNFDQVTVDYTGWLMNGKKFDSSIGRAPFTFIVGLGSVISGWDEGLIGMKVGGKRNLIIPPALGYGPAGAGPIPGNSTLKFTIELHKISQPIKEVTVHTDVQGTGPSAKIGDKIGFEFIGAQKDGTIILQDNPPSPLANIVLGKSPIIPGLIFGLSGMKLGEIRTMVIPPDLAFGSQPTNGIPPNSTIYFRVCLCQLGNQTAPSRPVLKPYFPQPAPTSAAKSGSTAGASQPASSGAGSTDKSSGKSSGGKN